MINRDPKYKDGHPDLQQYLCNLYLIHNVEAIVVFLSLKKCFDSNIFLLCKCGSHFCKETTDKNYQFSIYKYWNLIYTWSDKAFKGTVVNQARPALHGESRGITLTVPWNRMLCYDFYGVMADYLFIC